MTAYRKRAYILLTLVAVIWGVATSVIKFTLGGINPLPFLTYRFLLSSLLALLFILIQKPSFTKIKENALQVFVYGFITTTFALGILFIGLEKTTVVDTAIISAVGPLITAVAGFYFLKEHITNQEKLGMSLAFFGTLITVLEPVLRGQVGFSQLTGNFLVVGYIVIMALSSVLSKKLVRKGVEPLLLTNTSFIIGFFTLIPFVLFKGPANQLIFTVTNLQPQYHLGVIYMAFLSGTLAYTLWVKGLKSIEISEAGVFSYLVSIFAAILGVILFNDLITPPLIIGIIFIAIGVFIAEYKRRRR